MVLEATSRRSRRAVLAAALAAAGAAVAQAIGRPLPVRAAGSDGQTIHIADLWDDVQTQTTLGNKANNNTVLYAASNTDLGHGGGTALWGYSGSGLGVRGDSGSGGAVAGYSTSGYGVWGQSAASNRAAILGWSTGASTGVFGTSGGGSLVAPAKTGVYGEALQDADSRGVTGSSAAGRGVNGVATTGRGVHGQATTGTGVHAQAGPTGTALRVMGKARFSRSGKIAVSAGASSVTKTLAGVTASTMIFALLQSNEAGVWVRAAVPTAGGFAVHFNKALPTNASVAWFVLG